MVTIGIIVEYSPFHNGHIYHINKIKELFPDSLIIAVMSSSFTQRGIPSIINKWDKTEIALNHQVDLVIELPYLFSTQSADYFAKESINILNNLKVDYLIFGSECDNIDLLTNIAEVQLHNNKYPSLVQKYLKLGVNYPTALNKSLEELNVQSIDKSNDLLGLSYVKEIINSNSKIKPITIKRTNNYLSKIIDNDIASATSIRELIANKKDIKKYVPIDSCKILSNSAVLYDMYFNILKYKINSDNNLDIYLDVDEGIEHKIKDIINKVDNYDQLVMSLKTKRYTYNKINRMLSHILCGLTKEFKDNNSTSTYIRVLGFNKKGQVYLNKIKKGTKLPIYTKYISGDNILDFEKTVTTIYASILDNKLQKYLYEKEYKNNIIIK